MADNVDNELDALQSANDFKIPFGDLTNWEIV